MRASKLLLSGIFFILAVGFCLCGVLLFNSLPDTDAIAYLNLKDSLRMAGAIFSFIFAFGGLSGSVGFLVVGIMDRF